MPCGDRGFVADALQHCVHKLRVLAIRCRRRIFLKKTNQRWPRFDRWVCGWSEARIRRALVRIFITATVRTDFARRDGVFWRSWASLRWVSTRHRPGDLQEIAAGGATEPEDIDQVEGLVLAMMYGNGQGVPAQICRWRNSSSASTAEGSRAKPHDELLSGFDKTIAAKEHFDVCADDGGANGRSVMYFCSGDEDRQAGGASARLLEVAIAAANPPKAQASLACSARSSGGNFARHMTRWPRRNAQEGLAAGCTCEADDAQAVSEWLDALKEIREGKAPAAGANAAEFAKVDSDLNGLQGAIAGFARLRCAVLRIDGDSCSRPRVVEVPRGMGGIRACAGRRSPPINGECGRRRCGCHY